MTYAVITDKNLQAKTLWINTYGIQYVCTIKHVSNSKRISQLSKRFVSMTRTTPSSDLLRMEVRRAHESPDDRLYKPPDEQRGREVVECISLVLRRKNEAIHGYTYKMASSMDAAVFFRFQSGRVPAALCIACHLQRLWLFIFFLKLLNRPAVLVFNPLFRTCIIGKKSLRTVYL